MSRRLLCNQVPWLIFMFLLLLSQIALAANEDLCEPDKLEMALGCMGQIDEKRSRCLDGDFLDYEMLTCRSCDRYCPDERYIKERCGFECHEYFLNKNLTRQLAEQNTTIVEQADELDELQEENEELKAKYVLAIVFSGVFGIGVLVLVVLFACYRKRCESSRQPLAVPMSDVEPGHIDSSR